MRRHVLKRGNMVVETKPETSSVMGQNRRFPGFICVHGAFHGLV
jgi:hypothetical protein